jgi:hypothetical protein
MKFTFFSYTSVTSPSTWGRRLARWWFVVKTASLRARFHLGWASFVEADVRMTTHSVAEVREAPGRAPQSRLLSHYELRTGQPRGGAAGWRRVEEGLTAAQPHRMVCLSCGYCGHRFVIQVLTAIDPLANELTGARGPGSPASYASPWFRFCDWRWRGPASLNCPRCEERGDPRLAYLNA